MMKCFLYHFSGISLNDFFFFSLRFCFVRWLFFSLFAIWKMVGSQKTVAAITFNELLVLCAVKHSNADLFLVVRFLHEYGFYSSFGRSSIQCTALLINDIYLIASRLNLITKNFHTISCPLFNQNFCLRIFSFCREKLLIFWAVWLPFSEIHSADRESVDALLHAQSAQNYCRHCRRCRFGKISSTQEMRNVYCMERGFSCAFPVARNLSYESQQKHTRPKIVWKWIWLWNWLILLMNIPLFFCRFFFLFTCGFDFISIFGLCQTEKREFHSDQVDWVASFLLWSIVYHLLENTIQRMSFYLCKFIQFQYLLTTHQKLLWTLEEWAKLFNFSKLRKRKAFFSLLLF